MEIFWAQVIKSLAEMTGPDATFDRLNIFPEAQILSEAVWRFRSFIIIWAFLGRFIAEFSQKGVNFVITKFKKGASNSEKAR